VSLFAAKTAYSQVPDAINFQAIARDASGEVMGNTQIMIQLTILDGSAEGPQVYREIRSLMTNAYGSFAFQIGRDPYMNVGSFTDIDWADGYKFMKVDYDPTASLGFDLTLGTIEFVTVPYAFTARDVVYIDATGAVNGDVLVFNEETGKFEPGQVGAGSVTWENVQGRPTNLSDFTNDEGFLTGETDPSVPQGTTIGQMQYWNGSEWVILPAGEQGQVLSINSSNIPTWQSAGAPGLNPPVAQALEASNIESYSAQINGNINANGLSTTVVFEWGTTTDYGNSMYATPQTVTGITNTAVNKPLAGLQSNTTYHYRIKATNAVDISYSNDMSFTTEMSAPQLTTNSINNILAFSAVGGGNITYDGGSPVTTRGICWSTSPNPTTSNTHVASGEGTGPFTINLTNLTHNTTYYVRAYAINAVGISYGNEITFTTQSGVITLTTTAISSITGISAVSGGNITDDGGTPVTSRGVCWSTSPNPTTLNSSVAGGNGMGPFTINLAGLANGTTYYVRAYATNAVGTSYGNEISFKTVHPGPPLTDIRDGKVYQTVHIGSQTWMAENLAYKPSSGNYWAYNNDDSYIATYGYLYDWNTAMNGAGSSNSTPSGVQGICPEGWHLPSDAEWTQLTEYLGGEGLAGGKLKEAGTDHWQDPNAGANNETGFTALPGGRYGSGNFDDIGSYGYWWSATEYGPIYAWYRYLTYSYSDVSRSGGYKSLGFSVRCVRD